MSTVVVRHISAEVYGATSVQAEVRAILDSVLRQLGRVRLGSTLAKIGKRFGGVDLKIERDKTPAQPPQFV